MLIASLALAVTLSAAGPSAAQSWATATSTHSSNGRVIVFRYISDFVAGFERSTQPVRVILVWKYKGRNGMPIPKVRERMDEMEDLLAPVVEADGFASLALVSTGENLREWIYYVKTEDGFLERINQALGGRSEFPIEIHTAQDPTWSNYQTFIDGLKQ
jgi:Family of unknown function (DUF695)